MSKFKIIFICIFLFISCNSLYSSSIQIVTKVQNNIITNIDIENEIKYLLFLNPKLNQLNNKQLYNIAKNSLITEIIKKKEIEKIYNLEKEDKFFENIEKRFLKNKNIQSKTDFIEILNSKNISYKIIKKKLQIEALWNKLIYSKYSKNIKLNEDELKQSILNQFENKSKKFEYNLSEIFFTEIINESLNETLNKLNESINEIGFENTANVFSISSTSKNGGLIGWVNELQISEVIKQNLIQLNIGEVSKPIKIGGGYLIIKVNNKRESAQDINIDNQLKELINKETNRQLNTYSVIFYKRLKKNIQIDEF